MCCSACAVYYNINVIPYMHHDQRQGKETVPLRGSLQVILSPPLAYKYDVAYLNIKAIKGEFTEEDLFLLKIKIYNHIN